MFERFTDRSRKVMALANQEAQRLNHEYIGTEHVLLGLVKESTGVGAQVLSSMGVDLATVRGAVLELIKAGPEIVTFGKFPRTPRVKKVIEYAIEEAQGLGHDFVGTEHMLLGLVREHDGVAAQVLRNLGLDLEATRAEVLRRAGENGADRLGGALSTSPGHVGLRQSAAPATAFTGDPMLLEWLASHDSPCPVCSYNLRGLKSPSCPECGAPLHLAVGSENLNLGPWVLAIAGPILAMGFDGVVSVLMSLGMVIEPPASPGARWYIGGILGVFLALAALCGAAVWVLIKRRRGWMMMARRRQWAWAWGIFAIVGVLHAVYGAVLALTL